MKKLFLTLSILIASNTFAQTAKNPLDPIVIQPYYNDYIVVTKHQFSDTYLLDITYSNRIIFNNEQSNISLNTNDTDNYYNEYVASTKLQPNNF